MATQTMDFEDWYNILSEIASKNDGSVADVDAWREDYDAGKSPEQAWQDAWG